MQKPIRDFMRKVHGTIRPRKLQVFSNGFFRLALKADAQFYFTVGRLQKSFGSWRFSTLAHSASTIDLLAMRLSRSTFRIITAEKNFCLSIAKFCIEINHIVSNTN